jgi:hypothetical protein
VVVFRMESLDRSGIIKGWRLADQAK